ncbi:MAG: biopolymer transporter ExbD, partial [Gammaproteobacteria bacterium]|nr:biopolymer transporter ExbD [Gammaproteobacteria bacterium]
MARRHATGEEDAEINITPMLDIVFIMLIFFIVTTSFIKETGIDPNRPEAETAAEKARGNILIAISPAGQVWMNKDEVELTQIRGLVEAARAESPESSVIVIADEQAP